MAIEIPLSDYLKKRQKELNLTSVEISQRARISRQTWYRIAKKNNIDKVRLTTIASIARVLKISPVELANKLIEEGDIKKSPAS